MMGTDILVISSDEPMRHLMQIELKLEGYSVQVEADSANGCLAASEFQPRLLILDVSTGLPSEEPCKRLRGTNIDLKIILLTDADSVQSTEALIDDYIFKPLNLTELMVRVAFNLRQTSPKTDELLCFEDLSLDLKSYEVYRDQRKIELTLKEFELLAYLLKHPQQVLERDQILEEIWGWDCIGHHNLLNVAIRSLRKKLEEAAEPRLVQTVRGVGYVLKSSTPSFPVTLAR